MAEHGRQDDWSVDTLRDLLDGKLDSDTLRNLQSRPKDPRTFTAVRDLEQARVPWPDRIVVPLQEHLYVVECGTGYQVKAACGHTFGDYRRHWKYAARVYERDPQDGETFAGPQGADPNWMVLREFYCPGCGTQLEVEAVPPGHPFIENLVPDVPALLSGQRRHAR